MRNHNIYHHIKGSQKKEIAQLNGFANMNFQKKSLGANLPPPGLIGLRETKED